MAISLFDMRRIIHSEKKSKVSSNLKIIETWAEFDESGNNTTGNIYPNGRYGGDANTYYLISGTISVTSPGKCTFALRSCQANYGGNTQTLVTISKGTETYTIGSDTVNPASAQPELTVVNFAAAGNYTITIEQYWENGSDACVELSAASGEVSEFSTSTFTLLGAGTIAPAGN